MSVRQISAIEFDGSLWSDRAWALRFASRLFGLPPFLPRALAEFERDLIRERTQAGLQAARARGRKGGRPRSLDARKLAQARSLHKDPANTVAEICATLGISRATFYRHLASPAEGAGADGHRGESLRAARRSVKRSRPGRPRAKGAK